MHNPYQHRFMTGSGPLPPAGKVVCVGRNYAEHARELDNPIPSEPLLFMKPATALCHLAEPIRLPDYSRECHHELELAVLIGHALSQGTPDQALAAVAGYALALDLTLRDVQARLKAEGHPWERAKAFDGSCPVSDFVPPDAIDPRCCSLSLTVDGERRQAGNTQDMLWPVADLLAEVSRYFRLQPGDLVLTGTPAGVGSLAPGQRLELELDGRFCFEARVAG